MQFGHPLFWSRMKVVAEAGKTDSDGEEGRLGDEARNAHLQEDLLLRLANHRWYPGGAHCSCHQEGFFSVRSWLRSPVDFVLAGFKWFQLNGFSLFRRLLLFVSPCGPYLVPMWSPRCLPSGPYLVPMWSPSGQLVTSRYHI